MPICGWDVWEFLLWEKGQVVLDSVVLWGFQCRDNTLWSHQGGRHTLEKQQVEKIESIPTGNQGNLRERMDQGEGDVSSFAQKAAST